MNTAASRPAKYSRTEIAQRVRGALAEKLQCDLAAAPESALLRGAGPECLGLSAVDILEMVSQLERSLGDLRDVRLVAFDSESSDPAIPSSAQRGNSRAHSARAGSHVRKARR